MFRGWCEVRLFYDTDPSSIRLCLFDCMCLPIFLRVTSTPHAHRHFLFKCTSFLCSIIKCSLLNVFPHMSQACSRPPLQHGNRSSEMQSNGGRGGTGNSSAMSRSISTIASSRDRSQNSYSVGGKRLCITASTRLSPSNT